MIYMDAKLAASNYPSAAPVANPIAIPYDDTYNRRRTEKEYLSLAPEHLQDH